MKIRKVKAEEMENAHNSWLCQSFQKVFLGMFLGNWECSSHLGSCISTGEDDRCLALMPSGNCEGEVSRCHLERVTLDVLCVVSVIVLWIWLESCFTMSQRNRRISVSRRRNGHLERHLLSDPSCSLDVGKYLGLPKINPFFLVVFVWVCILECSSAVENDARAISTLSSLLRMIGA